MNINCNYNITLTKQKFINAIENEFEYEMWIDNLPVFGQIGFSETNQQITDYYLITHRQFEIIYDKYKIVDVKIATLMQDDEYIQINNINDKHDDKQITVDFTYSVTWINKSDMQKDRNEYGESVVIRYLWLCNNS